MTHTKEDEIMEAVKRNPCKHHIGYCKADIRRAIQLTVREIFKRVENIICHPPETCGIDSETTGGTYWCVECRLIIKEKTKRLGEGEEK